jgi:hypothetical protein
MLYVNIENNGMKETKYLKINLCMTGVPMQQTHLDMGVCIVQLIQVNGQNQSI